MCLPTLAHDFAHPSGCQVDVTRSSSFIKHSHSGNNGPRGTVKAPINVPALIQTVTKKTHGVINAAYKSLHLISSMCIRLPGGAGGLGVACKHSANRCFS